MTMIRPRAKAGPLGGLVLSLAFGAVLLPIATVDLWLYDEVPTAGHPARLTVRTPELALYHNTGVRLGYEHRRIIVPRGQTVEDADTAALLREYSTGRRPPGLGLVIGLGLAYVLAGLLFTSYLRNFGYRGNLLRTQLALLGALAGFVALAKLLLVLTPLAPFYVPLALLAVPIAMHLDRQVAFATTVAAALLVGTLVPFDLVLSTVLLVEGFAAVLGVRRVRRKRAMITAGLVGGAAAAAIYVAIDFLLSGRLPYDDVSSITQSGLLGCLLGGLLGGLCAYVSADAIEHLLGGVPKPRLYELAELENPLLKKIAQNAPGTWAHSLAMANLAEIAANAIGANALLVRVGAYYHDLGKAADPRYYIENLQAGERSPHEDIDPDISADAIFAHCTEGVKMGRRAGLPEPVIDFMHMHHGNGLLEYFWVKNQELGNPKGLAERDFRYPGIPPQTRETAILALCDAVEAASRTLRQPAEERQIENLVQRIIFGKMRLGQLDQSGLSLADLRKIAASLTETLKNSFHSRIEYPWQRDERAQAAAAALGQPAPPVAGPSGSFPEAAASAVRAAAGRPPRDPSLSFRLDSADAPRPYQIGGELLSGSFAAVRPTEPPATPAPSPAPSPAPAAPENGTPVPAAAPREVVPAPAPARAPTPVAPDGEPPKR